MTRPFYDSSNAYQPLVKYYKGEEKNTRDNSCKYHSIPCIHYKESNSIGTQSIRSAPCERENDGLGRSVRC